MIICPFCGVELQDNANYCSLCGEPVSKDIQIKPDHLSLESRREREQTKYKNLSRWQQRKIFLEIAALILCSGVLITTTINLLHDRALTWSVIVMAAALVLFINFSLILFYYRKRTRIFLLSYLSSVAFILLIHYSSGHSHPIIQWSIPIVFLAAYLIVFGLIALIRKMKQKGLNLIAFSIIAGGLLCLCIEAGISLYTFNRIDLNWSLIALTAAIFISALLFYLHGRLKKLSDLKRFFHI
ncbi:MAG: DUF6320 domain-containing protein [Bacteroidales bacterium]|jgi:hypothetical protein|nr:zinc ribbon domain-containing protein [Bacteroidales bacterium]MDD2617632.1 DUF6320 domain-containing protein [Bacteroidales bacterium]MDD4641155.1 DUF6320 domain-containing protein [Bacteroidales bacterium]